MNWLIALLFAGGLLACWILPYRLATGPGGSFYTFGYINEEYFYAQRMQPLVEGTSRCNTYNRIVDPAAYSTFYLEDAGREVMALLGMDVVSFCWLWRLMTPLVLAACFVLLAMVCLPRKRAPWGWELRLASAGALLMLLYVVYAALGYSPFHNHPLYGYINRIPSNVEFPISLLMCGAMVYFVARPSAWRGMVLMVLAVILIYTRFYAAIPWGLALVTLAVCLLLEGRLRVAVWVPMLAVFLAGLVPFFALLALNRNSAGYQAVLSGNFIARPYGIHPHWSTYLALAALCVPLVYALSRRWRAVAIATLVCLATLPFVCGLYAPLRWETLLDSDRYISFHLPALAMLALLLLGERSLAWRGRASLHEARCQTMRWLVAGAAACVVVVALNLKYDFAAFPDGAYRSVVEDGRCLPAYEWVRQHTPADALFLVDDGFDWSRAPRDRHGYSLHTQHFQMHEDLFQVVARRQRVFKELFCARTAVLPQDAIDLEVLQRGTFGFPVEREKYARVFNRFRPRFIFWRKFPPVVVLRERPAPIPRGGALWLQDFSHVVYDDEFCQVWELKPPPDGLTP